MIIAEGIISKAVWDAIPETGTGVRSSTDEVFRARAAEAEQRLLTAQDPSVFSGEPEFSIYAALVTAALESAEYKQPFVQGDEIALVNGAADSSRAILEAVNLAGRFVREVLILP